MSQRCPMNEHFWRQVDASGDCWVWIGSMVGHTGYGKVGVAGRTLRVHRYAWEQLVGPIPAGMYMDHLCRNRACVNPDHLEIVTPHDSALRGPTRAAQMAAKTRCVNGHLYDEANTGSQMRGRACKECRRTWARAAYYRDLERNRERARDYQRRHRATLALTSLPPSMLREPA